MPDAICPVTALIRQLEETLGSGRMATPWNRRITEEILDLLKDVAWGRAGADHLPAIRELAGSLRDDPPTSAGLEAKVEQAARECPEQAIVIEP